MEKKLKHLTILKLATERKTLPYDDLMAELDIKNVRHLEDIIIEAIYAELINGKLDQKNRQLEIDYAVARDIQTESIQEIVSILSEWLKSCESCSHCLQEQIENANAEKAKRAKHKEHVEEQVRSPALTVSAFLIHFSFPSSSRSRRISRSNRLLSNRTTKRTANSWQDPRQT